MDIVIIGNGNLAFHLASILNKSHKIVQIYARNAEKAQNLSKTVNSEIVSKLSDIKKDADLYLLCVKDDAIEKILSELKIDSGIVAHCSGSVDIKVFKKKFKHYGVFYPLMSFTKEKELLSSEFPLCFEASDLQTMEILKEIGNSISLPYSEINSEQRKTLHLAAVTVNNFTNFLYTLAFNFLKENKIDNSLLFPLMQETLYKAIKENPEAIQTGPAKRKDKAVIKKHLELLESFTEYKKMYSFVSEQIFTYYNEKQNGKF
ncbi:MAG: DUF2520 domain-containing protein [Bacteroidales bacterium]|nr:DUF2520 domain-containing protein [Bacteroidales bacterium]